MKKPSKKSNLFTKFMKKRIVIPSWVLVSIVIAFFVIYYITTSFLVNKITCLQ